MLPSFGTHHIYIQIKRRHYLLSHVNSHSCFIPGTSQEYISFILRTVSIIVLDVHHFNPCFYSRDIPLQRVGANQYSVVRDPSYNLHSTNTVSRPGIVSNIGGKCFIVSDSVSHSWLNSTSIPSRTELIKQGCCDQIDQGNHQIELIKKRYHKENQVKQRTDNKDDNRGSRMKGQCGAFG